MKNIDYNGLLIPPTYSDISSRSEVDLSTTFRNIDLRLPIISANMKTVTGTAMVKSMHSYGGLGILHRFWSIEENVLAYDKMFQSGQIPRNYIGVSVGVREKEKERFIKLHQAGASLIVVDAAHGHHLKMKNMIEFIKKNSKFDVTIVAGNVATEDAAISLFHWGADIIKVGIGSGFGCLTRRNTGIGVPQLKALRSIKKSYPEIPLISDGGCSTVSDIAHCIAAGADTVMLGSILAGTIETPGKVYPDDSSDLVKRTFYKVYGGSSSAQLKGENKFVEGKITTIPFKGHVKYILREIEQGLQSTCSYRGCRTLDEFKKDTWENFEEL